MRTNLAIQKENEKIRKKRHWELNQQTNGKGIAAKRKKINKKSIEAKINNFGGVDEDNVKQTPSD